MKYTIAVAMFLASSQAIKLDRRHHHHHHNGDKKPKGKKYEPEWGHNSGNSYNNGPTDHFYHGKASPYNVAVMMASMSRPNSLLPMSQSGDTTPEIPMTMFHSLTSTTVKPVHTTLTRMMVLMFKLVRRS